VYIVLVIEMVGRKKPKRLSTDDFNAIYELLRSGSKAPEVRPVQGYKIDYREQ
jgi:hypothetical protein